MEFEDPDSVISDFHARVRQIPRKETGIPSPFVVHVEETSFQAIPPVRRQPPQEEIVTSQPSLAPPDPVVMSVEPDNGNSGGNRDITVRGENFLNLDGVDPVIRLDNTPCDHVVLVDENTLTGKTPGHADGPVDVEVENATGQKGVKENAYTFHPIVDSINPNNGSSGGGTAVTIDGDGFKPGVTVLIGGALCTSVVLVSNSRITAVTPNHNDGPATVEVRNQSGYSGTLTDGYTFHPAIDSISPNVGGPGSIVVIHGGGFMPGITVSIGGVACTSVTRNSGSQITATVGDHANGQTTVVVTNPTGYSGSLVNGFLYMAAPDFYLWESDGPPLTPWGFSAEAGHIKGITIKAFKNGVFYPGYQGSVNFQVVSAGSLVIFNFLTPSPYNITNGQLRTGLYAALNTFENVVQSLTLRAVDNRLNYLGIPVAYGDSPSMGILNP